MPPYPDAIQWSTTHNVQVSTVSPNNDPDAVTGICPTRYEMMERTYVFDTNIQKELLSKYE